MPPPAWSGVKKNSGSAKTTSHTAVMGAAMRSCSNMAVSRPNITSSGSQPQSSRPDAGSAKQYSMAARMKSAPPLPSARPQPDTVPRRWYGTTDGSMALWNTSVKANPVPATASATARVRMPKPAWPGTAIHSSRMAGTIIAMNAAIHGLRRPTLSAMAPRNQTGGDEAREAVDVAPDFLAAHRIADDLGGEVRAEDVDDDENVVGIARPLEERPAHLPQRPGLGVRLRSLRWRRWRRR